ncbi:MAG: SPFH domain-containing protein [Pseudomonadota bacterium]|nr:SPFH domain-containing protein [Pseudomonadota bacterium]
MFGIRYFKSSPTLHLLQYRRGQVVREGVGASFFYYAPTSTLVGVPIGSQERAFIFEATTADFQRVTVQGQVSWRVAEPRRLAQLLDFSLRPDGRGWASEDPERLGERIATLAEVIVQQHMQALPLPAALAAAPRVADALRQQLAEQPDVADLGLHVLGAAVVAIKPTPDIARALEATAREAHLKAADEAVYLRRMAAVEKERAIRENELQTDVAVEHKKRQIQDAQIEAEAARLRSDNAFRAEQMAADVALEAERTALVQTESANRRTQAEAEAFRVAAVMQAFAQADLRVVQALAAAGMQPGQLIAQAFGDLAGKAERIGQLNVSPDLLQSLMQSGQPHSGQSRGAS